MERICKKYGMTLMCLAFALVLGSLTACSDQTILVAWSGPLTGPNSQLGIDGRNAAEMFVDDINQRGGLSGHRIKLMIADDQSNAILAESQDMELFGQGATFLVGHYLSSMAPAIMGVMESREALFISPTISLTSLSGLDDGFIRTYPDVTVQAGVLAEAIVARGAKRVITVHETGNGLYTRPLNNRLGQVLTENGVDLIADLPFASTEKGHSELAARILALQPDAVLLSMSGLDAAQMAQQLRKSGQGNFVLYGPNWPQTAELIQNGGRAVEGMIFPTLVQRDPPSPQLDDFSRRYQARFGQKPGFASYLTYELFMMFEASLKADPKPLTAKGIKEAILSQGRFEGLQSPFAIDAYGDARKDYMLVEVRNGAFVPLGK